MLGKWYYQPRDKYVILFHFKTTDSIKSNIKRNLWGKRQVNITNWPPKESHGVCFTYFTNSKRPESLGWNDCSYGRHFKGGSWWRRLPYVIKQNQCWETEEAVVNNESASWKTKGTWEICIVMTSFPDNAASIGKLLPLYGRW